MIVVTAPTGQIGGQLFDSLLAAHAPLRLAEPNRTHEQAFATVSGLG
jgi:uncharacterized protein YbjT (DUF2867 family)